MVFAVSVESPPQRLLDHSGILGTYPPTPPWDLALTLTQLQPEP